ncbi:MAG: methyltransferase domain-containing protein [bacterium]|nr:methyltransferase domain-containing protein [bacterium]
MMLLCPICHTPLHLESLRCVNGHEFSRIADDFFNLLSPDLSARLDAIARYREKVRDNLPTITDYESLPYNMAKTHFEWRHRAQSADIALRLIQQHAPKTILEIGGWNGWLTHHLAKFARVISADFFADEHDGLGAMNHYSAKWARLQMDITDLTILAEKFNMVVINNGLHLLPNPLGTIQQAQQLVADGGVLVVLELPFIKNPTQRIAQLRELETRFTQGGGEGSLFLYPTKGYLDPSDRYAMQKMGLRLRPYPRYKAILKAMLLPHAPMTTYGVWHG